MDENKTFRCDVDGCGKAFWFKAALQRHRKTHIVEPPDTPVVTWGCSDCPKFFCNVESLRRHFKTTHGNVVLYPCDFEGCNQMFQRKDNLVRHARSHKDGKNCCDICGRSFARKDALTRHKKVHTKKKNVKIERN